MPLPIPQGRKINLSQAIAASEHNPLLLAAIHQINGARANLSGQRVPINPTINYAGLNNTVASLNPGDLTNYNIYFPLETSGRQRWRTAQARAQLQGTEADVETTRLTVLQTVTSAYIDLQVANLTLGTERETYKTARRLSDLTEKQFQLGAASETNAIRSSIAMTQEEQNLLKAVNDVRLARANLNVQMGRSPDELVDAAEPLEYKPLTVQIETLQKLAVEMRPEIRSAEANKRALQANIGLQRSQYYPDLIFGTNGRFDELQLGLSMPLFDFGGVRGSVRKAKEDVKVQEAQAEQVRQSVRLDVEVAYLALARAQQLVNSFQNGILPRAESLFSRVGQGYKLGASTILDLIDAQQTYRAIRNDYYAAIGDYHRALAQLGRATGKPLETGTPIERKTP